MISSVQTGFVSVNIADDADLCHYMEAQEQTIRTQQEALDNIQHLLEQLLNNQP